MPGAAAAVPLITPVQRSVLPSDIATVLKAEPPMARKYTVAEATPERSEMVAWIAMGVPGASHE